MTIPEAKRCDSPEYALRGGTASAQSFRGVHARNSATMMWGSPTGPPGEATGLAAPSQAALPAALGMPPWTWTLQPVVRQPHLPPRGADTPGLPAEPCPDSRRVSSDTGLLFDATKSWGPSTTPKGWAVVGTFLYEEEEAKTQAG